jgi:hypothetical protein
LRHSCFVLRHALASFPPRITQITTTQNDRPYNRYNPQYTRSKMIVIIVLRHSCFILRQVFTLFFANAIIDE